MAQLSTCVTPIFLSLTASFASSLEPMQMCGLTRFGPRRLRHHRAKERDAEIDRRHRQNPPREQQLDIKAEYPHFGVPMSLRKRKARNQLIHTAVLGRDYLKIFQLQTPKMTKGLFHLSTGGGGVMQRHTLNHADCMLFLHCYITCLISRHAWSPMKHRGSHTPMLGRDSRFSRPAVSAVHESRVVSEPQWRKKPCVGL